MLNIFFCFIQNLSRNDPSIYYWRGEISLPRAVAPEFPLKYSPWNLPHFSQLPFHFLKQCTKFSLGDTFSTAWKATTKMCKLSTGGVNRQLADWVMQHSVHRKQTPLTRLEHLLPWSLRIWQSHYTSSLHNWVTPQWSIHAYAVRSPLVDFQVTPKPGNLFSKYSKLLNTLQRDLVYQFLLKFSPQLNKVMTIRSQATTHKIYLITMHYDDVSATKV